MPAKKSTPKVITAENISPNTIYSIDTSDSTRGFGVIARATKQPKDHPARFYCYEPGGSFKPFTCTIDDALRANIVGHKVIEDQDKAEIRKAFGEDYLVL